MGADESDPEMRFKLAVMSLLNEMCERIANADQMIGELNDYVESIDDDLSELEDMHDDEDDEDDELFQQLFEGFSPSPDDEGEGVRERRLRVIRNDQAAKVMLPVRCTACGAVYLAPGALGEQYICPTCGKVSVPGRLTPENTPVGKSPEGTKD